MNKQNNFPLGEKRVVLGRNFEMVSVEIGEIQEDMISVH